MLLEVLPLLAGDQGGCPPLCYVARRAASPGRRRPRAPASSLRRMLHRASMRTHRFNPALPVCVCVPPFTQQSLVLRVRVRVRVRVSGLGLGLGFYQSRFAAFSLRSMVVVTTATV